MDYRYHIQFRSATKHGNAYTLSKFPLEDTKQGAANTVACIQQQRNTNFTKTNCREHPQEPIVSKDTQLCKDGVA